MNDIKECIIILENTPTILKEFINKIPVDKYELIRKDNVWSIKKHLTHLLETQELLYNRLLQFKNEKNPEIKPYFPEKAIMHDGDVDELINTFKILRLKQINIINEYKIDDFNKISNHNQYIEYSLPILIRHIIMHDYWHMYRIEEIWLTKDEYIDLL